MALVSGTFTYSSSIDPSITDLYAKYTYDDTDVDPPVLAVMHGYQQNATLMPQEILDRFATAGVFAVAPGMRGRDGASGSQDSGAREIQDIIDAIEYVRANFTVSATRASVAGYSGGGGNAMALAAKFPDYFTNIASHFGMSDYTTWDEYSGVSVVYSWIGGTPAEVPEKYKARNAQTAITNYTGGKLYLFHDRQDAAVHPDQSEDLSDILAAAGYTNYLASYTDTGDADRWIHGYPIEAQSPDLYLTEAYWLTDTVNQTQDVWSVPESGTLNVIGYLVTKRFSVWLGDGTEHDATVEYRDGGFVVTPSATCEVTVTTADWTETKTVTTDGATFGYELDVGLMPEYDLDVGLLNAAPALTATVEDDGVALAWDDVTDETAYEILKSFEDIASNSFVTASTVAADTTSYKDSAVTAQHTYKYAVRPLYAVGDDPNSNLEQVTIPPVVTTSDAEASYVGPAVITLSRTGGVSPLTTYYKLNGGATQTATALTATAQGQNTIQYWSVDSGESPYTEPTRTETFTIASAVTTPTTPASLSVIFTDRITATSAVSTGATSYEFSRSVNGGAYSVVQDTSALTYVDTALVAGNTYTYRVRGHNSAGYSDYRVSETLTPVAPILEWNWTERRSKAVPVWTERPARVQEDSE